MIPKPYRRNVEFLINNTHSLLTLDLTSLTEVSVGIISIYLWCELLPCFLLLFFSEAYFDYFFSEDDLIFYFMDAVAAKSVALCLNLSI